MIHKVMSNFTISNKLLFVHLIRFSKSGLHPVYTRYIFVIYSSETLSFFFDHNYMTDLPDTRFFYILSSCLGDKGEAKVNTI